MALVDLPLLEEAVDARWVCRLRFVVAVEAILRVEGGVLTDVFYVDGDFWGRGGPGRIRLEMERVVEETPGRLWESAETALKTGEGA